ncbi:MAG: copper-binding protein [Phycisphaerales bacterium]
MKTLITTGTMVLIAGLALSGCTDTNSSTNAPQSDAHHDHDHDHAGHDHDHDHDHVHADRQPDTYTGIRGEITQLPDPSVPNSPFKIRHEQIRDFKTADGNVNVTAEGIAGMRSMTMPFPLAEGVTLDGYGVGDKVEFDFVVNWGGGSAAWEITRIEKLPADTELDYTNAIEEDIESLKDAAHDMMDHDHDHGSDGP